MSLTFSWKFYSPSSLLTFNTSFARIPEILRDPDMSDTREIKILHSNETDDFIASYEADGSIDYFSASPDRVSN